VGFLASARLRKPQTRRHFRLLLTRQQGSQLLVRAAGKVNGRSPFGFRRHAPQSCYMGLRRLHRFTRGARRLRAFALPHPKLSRRHRRSPANKVVH
jgi:hypothetical protein